MRAKLISGMILVGVVVSLIACGGKYGDAEKAYTEFADAMESYLQELEKADDAASMTVAINAFADDMEELTPQMKKLNTKYPELKDPNNIPEKLQPIKERSDEMAMQMAGTFMKVMPHMKDAEVRAAFERLGKIMMSVDK